MRCNNRLKRVEASNADYSPMTRRMGILRMVVRNPAVMVRRQRRFDIASDAFASAEEREENQRGDEEDLQNNGCDESTTLNFASALLEFGITFNEATTKEIRLVLRARALDHHTPPKIPLRGVGFGGADFSEVVFGKPAPLSQGCQVRASSAPFDTWRRKMFPGLVKKHYEGGTPEVAKSTHFLLRNRRGSIPT
jgi:hypothetical protein